MYWVYLIIFILAVLTPKFVQQEHFLLPEEDLESLVIFCFGAFAFMVYLAKEKTLLRVFREKLHLQKQTNIITKDLSDSYSYIGEMNRRLDIVKELIFSLPRTTAEALGKKKGVVYKPILETASLLSKADRIILGFVDVKSKQWKEIYQKDAVLSALPDFDAAELLVEGKFFWERGGHVIVRSPRQAKGISAFLIFAKTRNHIEDDEVFKILVSEALLLYSVEQNVIPS